MSMDVTLQRESTGYKNSGYFENKSKTKLNESNQDKQESNQDKQESNHVKQESNQVKRVKPC